MNTISIGLIVSVIANIFLIGFVFVYLRRRTHVDASNTSEQNIQNEYSQTEPLFDDAHERIDQGESLIHLFFDEPKVEQQDRLEEKVEWSPKIHTFVSYAITAILIVILIGIIKVSLPFISSLAHTLLLTSETLFLEYGVYNIEPLYVSALVLVLLSISLLIFSVRTEKSSLHLGSFILMLLASVYGAYVIEDKVLLSIFVGGVALMSSLYAISRHSFKELWISSISVLVSFGVMNFMHPIINGLNMYIYVLSTFLFILLSGILYLLRQNLVPDYEDIFFITTLPCTIAFLMQGFSDVSSSILIGYYLLVLSLIFIPLLFLSLSGSEMLSIHVFLGIAGIFVAATYSLMPSLLFNILFLSILGSFLYVYAYKGYGLAYFIYVASFLIVLRMIITSGDSGSLSYFSNIGFMTHIIGALDLLFLAGFIYRGEHKLTSHMLNQFCIMVGIMGANLVFSIGMLSEFARMKDLGVISTSDYAIISVVGLLLHGGSLIAVSLYRNSKTLFFIGIMLLVGAFAKFYILDTAGVLQSVFSYVTLACISLCALLVVLFPDYKKYIPKEG